MVASHTANMVGGRQLVAVCLLLAVVSAEYKLPSNFQRCKKSDPNLNACLLKAFQNAVPTLKTRGIPEVGLSPLDPLDVAIVHLGSRGSVDVNLDFHNVKIFGFGNGVINTLRVDLNKPEMEFTAHIPRLTIRGPYKVQGKVLLLPIVGEGECVIMLEQVQTKAQIIGELFTKKNRKYWNVSQVKLQLTPSKLSINLENLFNGNKTLGDGMNKVLNQNWQVVYHDLQPSIQNVFGDVLKKLANTVFTKIATDDIFLN